MLDYDQQPVSGVALEIGGKVTTTDANGNFKVSGVAAKYDAYVIAQVAPGAGTNEAYIYEGLSDREKDFYVTPQGPARSAKIRGVLSGGAGFPLPAGHAASLVVTEYNTKSSVMGSTYELTNLTWQGSKQRMLTLGALSWTTDAAGLPNSYDGYGEKKLAVSDGASLGAIDGSTPATNITLAPVESRSVSGTLDLPDGCTPNVFMRVEGNEIIDDPVHSTSFSYVTPIVPEHPTTLSVRCEFADSSFSWSKVTLGVKNPLALRVPAPTVESLPIDGASNVSNDTVFAWTGEEERGDVSFSFGDWRITRVGVGHSTTFPDLSRFGLASPEGKTISWYVSTQCTDSSAAAEDQDFCYTDSSSRSFGTAPVPKPKD